MQVSAIVYVLTGVYLAAALQEPQLLSSWTYRGLGVGMGSILLLVSAVHLRLTLQNPGRSLGLLCWGLLCLCWLLPGVALRATGQ